MSNTMKYNPQNREDEQEALKALIARMCSALDALAPEEGEDRDDVELLIKAAHDILARFYK